MFILNFIAVIIFTTTPIWILFVIFTEKSKKQNTVNTEILNMETVQKQSLLSYVYKKNKWVWLKTAILAIILVPIYIALIKNTSPMGMAALALPFVLGPFIIVGVLVLIAVVLKLIFSILGYYFPNQNKFHISRKIIFIIIITLIVLNFSSSFIRGFINKYLKHSNQVSQNYSINNEIPDNFIKATFKTKDTNEIFTYIEKYVPNIPDSYDYDQNAVSNCISWQNNQCKKVYFIESNLDHKKLAIYNEKSDAVVGKIEGVLLFSEGKLVTQFPIPHKADDIISYSVYYNFNGKKYGIQRPENLCKNDNGKIICHDPNFKINDQVIVFHITGMNAKNLYGTYPVDKIIEAELLNYQEYKYGEIYPKTSDGIPQTSTNIVNDILQARLIDIGNLSYTASSGLYEGILTFENLNNLQKHTYFVCLKNLADVKLNTTYDLPANYYVAHGGSNESMETNGCNGPLHLSVKST